MLRTVTEQIKDCGKPGMVKTEPECAFWGCLRRLAARSGRLDNGYVKLAFLRVARRAPRDVTVQMMFRESSTAHTGLHQNRRYSPWLLLLGSNLSGFDVLYSTCVNFSEAETYCVV